MCFYLLGYVFLPSNENYFPMYKAISSLFELKYVLFRDDKHGLLSIPILVNLQKIPMIERTYCIMYVCSLRLHNVNNPSFHAVQKRGQHNTWHNYLPLILVPKFPYTALELFSSYLRQMYVLYKIIMCQLLPPTCLSPSFIFRQLSHPPPPYHLPSHFKQYVPFQDSTLHCVTIKIPTVIK